MKSSAIPAPLGPYVPGRGRPDADVMFIGEAPGMQEEQMRKCWVGKAGRELTRYARQAGIDVKDCWLTNLIKRRPTTRSKSGNVKPTAADIKRDEGELVDEIEKVRPTFIAAVGAVAARWLLGRSVFSSMEDCHAFPYATINWRAIPSITSNRVSSVPASDGTQVPMRVRRVVRDQEGVRTGDGEHVGGVALAELLAAHHFTCIPVYHPAAGLHSPEQQPVIYSDFMTLGKYVRGTLPCVTPRDLYPDPDYYEPRRSVQLVKSLPIAVDTEGLAGRVWGLSFSQFAGSAGVVRKTNRKVIMGMKEQLFR